MPRKNYRIQQLDPARVTPAHRALFNPADPAMLRCLAVLDGHAAGRIFTDDPIEPSWAVLQEGAFNGLYLGGSLHDSFLRRLVTDLRREGEVLVGLWQGDHRWSLLPVNPDYSGFTLEFNTRSVSLPLPVVPVACELQRLDSSLAKEILGRNLLIHMYGSMARALELGHGLCLVKDGTILCEAFAGPAADGVIEIGVETNPHHMHKGYAALTCAHLIQAMEQQGYRTYWNCASQNQASIALARKLGYGDGKEYRLLAWNKEETR